MLYNHELKKGNPHFINWIMKSGSQYKEVFSKS